MEAWPHYPDALMISNMIAGPAPNHGKIDYLNHLLDVHKSSNMTGGAAFAAAVLAMPIHHIAITCVKQQLSSHEG